MSEEPKKKIATICWNCKKATGGCRWSDKLKPVKGWEIIPTQKVVYGGASYKSCIVLKCPEFEQDATNYGLKRYKDGVIYDPMSKNT